MTNAEWKKLFSRLRTLRWLVRMKRHEASKDDYHNNAIFGKDSIFIGLMTSQRQRIQFTSTMNDLGMLLYGMSGGDIAIKNALIFLIADLWKVSPNYPNQSTILVDDFTAHMPVWEFLKRQPRTIDYERIGPTIQTIDSIIDSSVKDYLPKIMMLKLAI